MSLAGDSEDAVLCHVLWDGPAGAEEPLCSLPEPVLGFWDLPTPSSAGRQLVAPCSAPSREGDAWDASGS